MTTETDLANYALAYIGEAKISNIDDTNSKQARTCKQFLTPTIEEILRSHRWNCSIKRATLSRLVATPNHHYDYYYALPNGFLRLLELNGEQHDASDEFFEIENNKLATDADTAEIRYIHNIGVNEFDPLLKKAVALSLASTIAVPLTAKIDLQTQCYTLFEKAIGKARQIDAIEVGTREGRPMERFLSQSRLIRSRFNSFATIQRLFNRFPNS
jgi:hypothetical protein